MAATLILATMYCGNNPVYSSVASSSDPLVTIIPLGGSASVLFSVNWPDSPYSTIVNVTGHITAGGATYSYPINASNALYPPTYAAPNFNVC